MMDNFKKSRLLVLDDESNMRKSLARLLELEGFEVVTAGKVQEALELLDSLFFDVVITDLVLPDGNGIEILKFCTEYCGKTKVICITGRASTESAIEAIRFGAHDYVIKPFNFDMLLHSINSVLEKMRMEEEIGLEREKYRALVDDLKDAYFVLEDRRIVYANKSLGILLGTVPAELKTRRFAAFVRSDFQDKLRRAFHSFESSEVGVWHEELILCDLKGNDVPVDIKLSIAHDSDSRDVLVGLCREITERDVLWDRLLKAEKLALMGEMVAGIAHELNNKLTPILGFVELLRAEFHEESALSKIKAIHSSALGARRIVQSLLTFARKEKTCKKLTNINTIIDSALTLVHSSFSTTDIEVIRHLQTSISPVKVDAVQIEQVLANLFKNAFEAMGHRGRLTVETGAVGENVEIKISDTGPGIPEEIREKVFTPFFTTKQRHGGTGLGLSICHGIITGHGGKITLNSSDAGTSFVITLPACPELHTLEPLSVLNNNGKAEHNALKPGGGAMLVIDDEPEIGRLFQELFQDDLEIVVAENGKEALDALKSREFDLIISDIKMPLIDGIELYEALKTSFPHYLDRIIYTTGVTFEPATNTFLQRTNVPYLAKPFKVMQLVKMVNKILNRRKREYNAA